MLLAIPVTPDTLKKGSAIVKGVGHNPYLGFRYRDELLVKIGE